MMEMKFQKRGEGTENSNGCELDYWCEGFIEVHSWYLRIATCDQTGLEAFNGAISVSLNSEDKLGANGFSSFRKVINHCEGTHVLEGLNLLFNCLFPLFGIRTVQCFTECGWFLVASRACARSSKGKCNLSESLFICV